MDTTSKTTTGDTVRVLRASLHWSQAELGSRASLTRATVGRIERGDHEPTTSSLLKLADALGIDAGLLLGRSDE